MARRIVVLGATGSIGTQALEVAAASDELEVVGLSAARNWEQLVAQARESGARRIALTDPAAAASARDAWDGEVLEGPEGITELIAGSGADMVLNALVGSAGLGPTVATLAEGIDLALANKESLVVGGELVMSLAEGTGSRLIPVDSEHSAIRQLVDAESSRPGSIDRIVLSSGNQSDQAIEVLVIVQRNVGNTNAADVVGHARRSHGIEFGLHAGIRGWDQDRELMTPPQGIGHGNLQVLRRLLDVIVYIESK